MTPEAHYEQILKGIVSKDHWSDEVLNNTPRRVVQALREMLSGYEADVRSILDVTFEAASYDQLVLLRDIEFTSLCEHHVLPFIGRAHIGYIPRNVNGKFAVVGVSKLARLVQIFSKRLQLQERMTSQICDALVTHLNPLGAIVVIEAGHQCMQCRGVRVRASMVTSAISGVIKDDPAVRAEALGLISK